LKPISEGLVTTIIPVRNRAQMMIEAVESVLGQSYEQTEIIICDDHSDDDTAVVANDIAARYPETIRVRTNLGRGAGWARETGRQEARGEFIQYLDSDDLLLPQKFSLQVKALLQNPECGAAYGYIRLLRKDGSYLDGPFKATGLEILALFPRLLVERWWNTDAPLYRREVTDSVGAWSDLPYSQDWEYDARVGALGTKLVQTPDWVCVQRDHAGSRQTGEGRWLSAPDRVRFFSSLLDSAERAGVSKDESEMAHFSRWTFFHSRCCAYAGDSDAAEDLLQLSIRAKKSTDLKIYKSTAGIIGHRAASIAFESVRGRNASTSLSGFRS
jgi:glycosyltransferase involved in cell wall biosynthesis